MLDLDFWPLERFPVFNIADIGITVGALFVGIFMVMLERREAALDDPVVIDGMDEDPPGSDTDVEPPLAQSDQ